MHLQTITLEKDVIYLSDTFLTHFRNHISKLLPAQGLARLQHVKPTLTQAAMENWITQLLVMHEQQYMPFLRCEAQGLEFESGSPCC